MFLLILYSSCVPPVASDQRSSGLLVFLKNYTFIIYTRARGELQSPVVRTVGVDSFAGLNATVGIMHVAH